MKRIGFIAALAAAAPAALAEEVTLTTYYPSPRGVYTELRAGSLRPIDAKEPFGFELAEGVATVSAVDIKDEQTGRVYRLHISEGKVLLSDMEKDQHYLMLELPEDQGRKQR